MANHDIKVSSAELRNIITALDITNAPAHRALRERLEHLSGPPLHIVKFTPALHNEYDRTYVLEPHRDCREACPDALTARFHKGSWFVYGASVEIDENTAEEHLR